MGYKFNPLIYSGLDLVGNSGGGGAPYFMPPVPTEGDLPTPATDGELRVVLDTDHVYVYNGDTGAWRDTGLTESTIFGSTPNDIGYDIEIEVQGGIERNTLILQPADATHPGAISIDEQTIPGTKHFPNAPVLDYAQSNSFIGTNSSNEISSINSWNIDPNVGMANVYVTVDPQPAVAVQVQRFENPIDGITNTTDNNIVSFVLDTHFDRNDSGINHTGGLNTLIVNNSHEGTGQLDNRNGIIINMSNQDSGTSDNVNGLNVGIYPANGATVTGSTNLRLNLFGDTGNGTTVGQFQQINAFASNVELTNNYDVMTAGMSDITSNSFIQGYSLGLNNTVTTTNAVQGFSFNDGSNNDFSSGMFYAHSGTTNNSVEGYRLYTDTSSIADYIRHSSFDTSGTYNQLVGYQIQAGPSNTVSGSFNGFQVSDQGSSDQFNGFKVDYNGTSSTSAVGISLNMNGTVTGGNLRTLTVTGNGGGINLNSIFTPQSGIFFDQANVITAFMQVPDGSPITGTDIINQNLSSLIFAQDNVELGPLGLGVIGVGFVGQIAVAPGKQVDSISMALGGAGIPVQSTGGTVNKLTIYEAKGALPQGGTLNINSLYGFKIDPNFDGGLAANAWGVYIDDDIENYFKGTIHTKTGVRIEELGAGSGHVFINVPTGVSDYDLTLPTNSGVDGQVLTTDGTGLTSWTTLSSPGDIPETTFAGANNQTSPANVTGFAFDTAVRSFNANVSVAVDASADLYESFVLEGINRGTDWLLSSNSLGDTSLVTFDIDSSGQVTYQSGNYVGFNSLSIHFRAVTTSL